MADAGWYPDAMNDGWEAFYDGQRWTGDRRQSGAAGAGGAPGPAQGGGQQAQPGGWWQGPQTQQEPPAQSGQQAWQPPADQTQRIDRSSLPADLQAGQYPAQQAGQYPGQQPETAQQPYIAQQPTWSHHPEGQAPGTAPLPAQGGWADQQQGAWAPGQPAPGQPGQPGQGQPPQGGWQQPQWDEPKPRRRNRKPLIIAAAAVVVLAAGLVTWLVWPDDQPTLTYNGKQLASASTVLSKAEDNVQAVVKKRHGTSNGDTRCYFAQAKKPPKGQKKSDIEQNLRCGPVLFVDGDKSREYLSVPVTSKSASGNKVDLTPSSSLDALQPQAVPTDLKLDRPDGKSAPKGAGGLSVPKPPPASATELGIAELGPTSPPKDLGSDAVMVGRDTKVTLDAAGYIDRYGQGDDARSAPSGKKLVAFKVSYGEGDVSGTSSTRAQLLLPGQAGRELPDADSDQWIVASVPASGAKIRMNDGGFKQYLSLPDGKPDANNITVLRRTHRTAVIFKSFSVPVHLTRNDGATGNVSLRGRATLASLDFWAPARSSVHASSPQNALLSVNLSYSLPGSSKTYGFDPALLKLRVPGGRQLSARNIATGDKIYNVFDVPGTFTSGVLVVSGSEKIGGIKLAVRKAYSLKVSIAAG